MATNMLSVNQASFETDLSGWELVDHPLVHPNVLTTDQQASVEDGTTTGWFPSGATITPSTEHADHGSHSLAITATTAGPYLIPRTGSGPTSEPSVEPNTVYTMVGSFYTELEGRSAYLGYICRDAAGGNIGQYNWGSLLPLEAGEFTRVIRTITTPANAAHLAFSPSPRGMATDATETIWFDRAGILVGEVGADHWSLPSSLSNAATRVADANAPDGGYVMALTRYTERGQVEAETTTFPATPDGTYTAMADLRLPLGRLAAVGVDMLDASGGVLSSERAVLTGTGTWQTARVTDIAPSGTVNVRLRVGASDLRPDETVEVDRAGLFDGNAVAWAPGGQAAPALFITVVDPNRHRVGVALVGLESADPVYVDRILPDGRVERVRNAQGLEPEGGGVFFDDYDTPTDAGFRYRATQGGVVIATSDVVVLPSNGRFFLMDPTLPMSALPVIPAANAIPEWQRTAPVGVYRVLGRQDPIVVTDVRWWAEGEFTCYTLTAAQRDAFGQLSAQGLTVGLYGPAEVLGGIGRIYLVGSQVNERRVSPRGTEQAREWHVQVTQVAQPTQVPRTTPLVDWGDVVAAYPTWQDVVDNETDWTDVMTGVPGAEGTGPDVGWEW